jgi:hypothetical protein
MPGCRRSAPLGMVCSMATTLPPASAEFKGVKCIV